MEKTNDSESRERTVCKECLRSINSCFCKKILTFKAPFKLVILMHPKEFRNKVGTGRATFLSIKDSEIICDVDFSHNDRVSKLLNTDLYNAFVLYPGKDSQLLSKDNLDAKAIINKNNKTPLIFVIDGTWPCAKSMMKKSANLQALPRISFENTKESRFSTKMQPHKLCLSTLESVYEVLSLFKEIGLGGCEPSFGPDKMIDTFEWIVNYQIDASNDPKRQRYRPGTFKDVSSLKKPKKWEDRNLFFEK